MVDVSGSVSGTPMEAAIALGILTGGGGDEGGGGEESGRVKKKGKRIILTHVLELLPANRPNLFYERLCRSLGVCVCVCERECVCVSE
jgi:hypothetical protein